MKYATVVSRFVAIGPAVLVLALAVNVYAATPTLSLVTSTGDSVQISVTGDANSNVMFYYNVGSAAGIRVTTLGITNSSGQFSTSISSSAYGVNSGNSVYVIVNGQQSTMQTWPYTVTGTPVLSQSNLTIGLGQSISVYSQGSSANVYVGTNSSPSIANVVASGGQQITVVGNQLGSTTATICYVGTSSNCASLNITVQNGSTLSFNQNNLSLTVGQGITVVVSGGNGSYSITGNSNPSAVSAVVSGSNISVSALALGSTNINVCDGSGNCSVLYVTVQSSSSSGSLTFSSTNPSLSIGQQISISISGGSSYYVTGNTNTNIASQSLSGNVLTVSGLSLGATTITVCSTSNGCGSIYVTVNTSNVGQTVGFGVTNPVVSVGQSLSVALSGGSGYFVSSNPGSTIVQATVNGSTLTLYGASVGTATLTVCISTGGCGTVYVTVTSSSAATTVITNNNSTLLAAIQSIQTQLAQAVSQIQSIAANVSQLMAGLNLTSVNTSQSTVGGANNYVFTGLLTSGSSGQQVTDLQQKLASLGFYNGPITGYYASLTEAAVKAFQTAHGITAVGYVGPSTRTALNGQ